ncbi:endonuclease III domain-containing protein [bacterium]|nr:MAG: endonuclease III domain-containing protein [bacterium]
MSRQVLMEIYRRLYRAFGPQHWWPGETPFEVAVGAVLTQNTSWGNVEKAIENVKQKKALRSSSLHRMRHKELAKLIKPAGYFNIKAKRLKEFLNFLVYQYKGSMEAMKEVDTDLLRKELLGVHGIGPETADSILLYALQRPVFVIDAYTRRVLLRHGLVTENVTYDELQKIFHTNLAADTVLFNEYHALFVRLGKDYCRTRPRCEVCPLHPLLA